MYLHIINTCIHMYMIHTYVHIYICIWVRTHDTTYITYKHTHTQILLTTIYTLPSLYMILILALYSPLVCRKDVLSTIIISLRKVNTNNFAVQNRLCYTIHTYMYRAMNGNYNFLGWYLSLPPHHTVNRVMKLVDKIERFIYPLYRVSSRTE